MARIPATDETLTDSEQFSAPAILPPSAQPSTLPTPAGPQGISTSQLADSKDYPYPATVTEYPTTPAGWREPNLSKVATVRGTWSSATPKGPPIRASAAALDLRQEACAA
jgi:hypothetical protein